MKIDSHTDRAPQRPRIVIYGPPGAGKSTWASLAPTPLVIDLEDGAGGLPVDRVTPGDWPELLRTLSEVIRDHELSYETIVLDSISAAERMAQAAVCAADPKAPASVAEIPYGKGYAAAAAETTRLLRALDKLRGRMHVIVVAHEEVSTVSDPTAGDYSACTLALDKRARPPVIEWADVIGYAEPQRVLVDPDTGRARAGASGRSLILEPSPARVAKVRAGYGSTETRPLSDGPMVVINHADQSEKKEE